MPEEKDVVIIGGGPAGLAAAAALNKLGVEDIVILEREPRLGGILRQCIHDGFGLQRFGRSLSGPEYADIFIREIQEQGIEYHTDAAVVSLAADRTVEAVTPRGMLSYAAKAVVLAMGCRERSRGSVMIPGERPSGVFTAGSAQSYMNIYNRMPGREAVILGSGDIGLIMARRLTLEGAHVKAVFEIQDHPNGLERNIVQCLDDYGIPLVLKHTVTDIHGNSRLEGVTVSEVDDHFAPVPGTEKYYPCDTLILSVGLRPENGLLKDAGILIDPRTDGAVVDEHFMTSIPGIFSSGNVLHVHDLADYVSLESEKLASSVEAYLSGRLCMDRNLSLRCGCGIGHAVPQRVVSGDGFMLTLRVNAVMEDVAFVVSQGDNVLLRKKVRKAIPAEMVMLDIKGAVSSSEDLEVSVV